MGYENFESFYRDACGYFAQNISALICNCEFTKLGYSMELYNPNLETDENHGNKTHIGSPDV